MAIVDNLSRRRIDAELGVESLTPIGQLDERLAAWREVSGATIGVHRLTVGKDYDRLLALLRASGPTRWCTSPSSAPRPIR